MNITRYSDATTGSKKRKREKERTGKEKREEKEVQKELDD